MGEPDLAWSHAPFTHTMPWSVHVSTPNNVDFCRSTGEFPSMTLAERKHAAELCRAHWPGKVVVGISSTVVADCVELLEHACTQITTANSVSAPAWPRHASEKLMMIAGIFFADFASLFSHMLLYVQCSSCQAGTIML